MNSTTLRATVPLLAFSLLSSCGIGSAGIFSATSGSSSANGAVQLSGLRVSNTKTDPVELSFVLRDPEADTARIELFFRYKGIDYPLVPDREEHTLTVSSSPQGLRSQTFQWSFTQSHEDFKEGRLAERVMIWGEVVGSALPQSATEGVNAITVDLGNDPPRVVDEDGNGFADGTVPLDEVAGIAHAVFMVEDTSADPVNLSIEYALVDGIDVEGGELPEPDDYQTATPVGGVPPLGVRVTKAPTGIDFFWDVNVDLPAREHRVVLRATPDDGTRDASGRPVGRGFPMMSEPFLVDNNAEPVVSIDADSFSVADARRGIPVPYTAIDPEGDVVDPVFQWRREGQSFPPLPGTAQGIRDVLTDPKLRRQFQIATEIPLYYEGRLSYVTPSADPEGVRARLTELGRSAAGIFNSGGLLGRELEIRRSPYLLTAVSESWSPAQALSAPVAALPVRNGAHALLLEDRGGSWDLQEVELATGIRQRGLASGGAGFPSAMAWDRDRTGILVAAHEAPTGGAWAVFRVSIDADGSSPLAPIATSATGAVEQGIVRAVAPWRVGVVLLTVGSSLVKLDYSDPEAPHLSTILGPPNGALQAPWGLWVDENASPNRVLLAENGANRIRSLDLDSMCFSPLESSVASFPRPQALAPELAGSRLLVVTDDPTRPGLELHSVSLRSAVDLDGDGAADGRVREVAAGLDGATASLAVDGDSARLLVLQDSGALYAGGGTSQVRAIQAYDASTHTVTVDRPFAPALAAGGPIQRWRIADRAGAGRGRPRGGSDVFVWDSRDLDGEGNAFLRVTPLDTEIGSGVETRVGKAVASPLNVSPTIVQDPTNMLGPMALDVADLDQDGDLDMVTANSETSNLTVFLQEQRDVFTMKTAIAIPPLSGYSSSLSVAVGDLDGDGANDLVSNGPLVFYQTSPGTFGPGLALGTDEAAVAIADLNSDGLPDILSNGIVYFRETAGGFRTEVIAPSGSIARDVDGDGRVDIVNGATIYYQDAAGAFDPITSGSFYYSPAMLSDLDGDGDLDFITERPPEAPDDPGTLFAVLQIAPREFRLRSRSPARGMDDERHVSRPRRGWRHGPHLRRPPSALSNDAGLLWRQLLLRRTDGSGIRIHRGHRSRRHRRGW